MHIYLVDDFRIDPGAKRLVIPRRSIVKSEIVPVGKKKGMSGGQKAALIAVTIVVLRGIIYAVFLSQATKDLESVF